MTLGFAMSAKSQQLQIRVTPGEKAAIKRLALRAGVGISTYVLARALPPGGSRFRAVLMALVHEEEPGFALAELNDLLTGLSPVEFPDAVADGPLGDLSPYLQNYVAAMVEQAAHQKSVAPPAWLRDVEPLEEPRFVPPIAGLRLHLLRSSPVPFRRRNIFVDSAVGDRV